MPALQMKPGDVIDVGPLANRFENAKTTKLLETDHLKVMRMVMPAGKALSEHKAPGEIIVHCLEGKLAFTTMGKTEELTPGQLLCLPVGELHSVEAILDSSFLLTIVFTV